MNYNEIKTLFKHMKIGPIFVFLYCTWKGANND